MDDILSSSSSSLHQQDLTTTIHHHHHHSPADDHFDHLPDSLLLLILNKIGDVKTLGRCHLVSKRFQTLAPQVQNVVVRVDCVISDDGSSSSSSAMDDDHEARGSISSLFSIVVSGIVKPIQALGHFLGPNRPSSSSSDDEFVQKRYRVTHHSPTEVLRTFTDLRSLRIELPGGELGLEDDVLLKWRASFGSTLENCVILGASAVDHDGIGRNRNREENDDDDSNGSIPDSFYTDGGLRLRVVWTISSLIAASSRHYLLQPIIAEHETLEVLVLSDADGQGLLRMDKEEMEEMRVKPLSASLASKRTLVPALNMRLWYAPYLDLPDGSVLKGATLVAIKPSEKLEEVEERLDGSWVVSAFEEPYGSAARMLVKRRTYSLEMNSF